MTFTHQGEQKLDAWLAENAAVSWMVDPSPWKLEVELLGEFSLPLNLKGNERHPFYGQLKGLRKRARARARERPLADDTGHAR